MSEKEKLQEQVSILQQYVNEAKEILEKNKTTIEKMEQVLENLKDIAWDRQSKKESSQMYKVLQNDKAHTQVKSDVGNIKVDKDFMEKQTKKHLDNPNLRGMVTTEEMLSYPKVAKNVGAEYDNFHKSYTWKVRANDGSTIRYGSREYQDTNKQNVNRLLTTYSETERGQREIKKTGVGEQGQPHHLINDLNFLRPADAIITQTTNKNQANISTSKLSLLKSQAQENSRNQESRNTDSMIPTIQSKEELLLEMNKENKERELKEEENKHINTRTMQ
ncbi:hypothetical protein [Helicobacter pullorum]|uniref:Helicase n=1 Tax=Helicobacter pullorum TaxID=35818 RepID=A0A377Q2G9_9HELI|nr:hypothetical protein [Helicobacter pullorum]STQ88920.1 helicase [Helicobacter pullorum]